MEALNEQKEAQLLKVNEVVKITNFSRSTIYDWVSKGKFPRPINLSPVTNVWRKSDIFEWIENL